MTISTKRAIVLHGASISTDLLLNALRQYQEGDTFVIKASSLQKAQDVLDNDALADRVRVFADTTLEECANDILAIAERFPGTNGEGYSERRMGDAATWHYQILRAWPRGKGSAGRQMRNGELLLQCAMLKALRDAGFGAVLWTSDECSSDTASQPLKTLAQAALPDLAVDFVKTK